MLWEFPILAKAHKFKLLLKRKEVIYDTGKIC